MPTKKKAPLVLDRARPEVLSLLKLWKKLPKVVRQQFHVEVNPHGHIVEMWNKRDEGLGWSLAFVCQEEWQDTGETCEGEPYDWDGSHPRCEEVMVGRVHLILGGRYGKGGLVLDQLGLRENEGRSDEAIVQGLGSALAILTAQPPAPVEMRAAKKRNDRFTKVWAKHGPALLKAFGRGR